MGWVEKRANCTLQKTFDKIAEQIEQDVTEFNKLNEIKETRVFKFNRPNLTTVLVGEGNEKGGWMPGAPQMMLSIELKCIRATVGSRLLFILKQIWNIETLECDLKIDDKNRSLTEISQLAIGDILFD